MQNRGERMKVTIVAVGKLKERFWVDACEEYLRRLSGYAKVEVKEVADVDPKHAGGIDTAREKEGAGILAAIPRDSFVILLAIEGKQRTSEQLAQYIDELCVGGISNITFIIGGSSGVDTAIYDRADEVLSFGSITLPHNLARVVLLEQIYRAFKISHGEPYHK